MWTLRAAADDHRAAEDLVTVVLKPARLISARPYILTSMWDFLRTSPSHAWVAFSIFCT